MNLRSINRLSGNLSRLRGAMLLAPVCGMMLVAMPAMAGEDEHEGHAGDIFIGIEAGHIFTSLVDEDVVEDHEVRTFESEFGEGGIEGFSDEPGWEAFPGTFGTDVRVGWNSMAGISRWNGDGFDEGIDEVITVTYAGLSFEIGSAPSAGFDLAVQPDGGLHLHTNFFIDNPNGGAAAHGIYLVELELYSNHSSAEESEPFWIVFNNEADEEDHEAAVEWVEENKAGEEHCHGDFNDDHSVGVLDLLQVISDWGPCAGCAADMDGSGVVGVEDLLEVISDWGECH